MPYISTPSIALNKRNVANLTTIKFSNLVDGNETEMHKLRKACEHYGFFYLDLTGAGSGKFFENLETLDGLVKTWFAQSLEAKLKTESISLSHGYKRTGIQSGMVESTKDGWEALRVGRNELLARWGLPSVIDENQRLFEDFAATAHYITKTLLENLSTSLSLKGRDSLSHVHSDGRPNKSTLYFLHYPPPSMEKGEVGQNTHTDIGSLTLLFAPQWGLQALSPDTKEWEFVAPKAGHAIINVGDTLRFLSGNRFRSALHRAMPIENQERWCIAYFLRANDGTEFKDSDGGRSDAKSWYLRKFECFEKSHELQREGSVLTGGMSRDLGVLD